MCRFVAFLGIKVLLEKVLVQPINSIILQSLYARESDVRTNGDGFGVGWYAPDIDDRPAIFRSIFPAWSDSNLLHLTGKIKSPCFFAHVRAASVGDTSLNNCHPFSHQEWMLMHNGQVNDFLAVKRPIRRLLDDEIYNGIQGNTDSEHLFALFLHLSKGKALHTVEAAAAVLYDTLALVLNLVKEHGVDGPSYFNICLTNGKFLVATRFCSDPNIVPESLHYLERSVVLQGKGRTKKKYENCVLIASEQLTDVSQEWQTVPPNYMLMVDSDKSISLRSIAELVIIR